MGEEKKVKNNEMIKINEGSGTKRKDGEDTDDEKSNKIISETKEPEKMVNREKDSIKNENEGKGKDIRPEVENKEEGSDVERVDPELRREDSAEGEDERGLSKMSSSTSTVVMECPEVALLYPPSMFRKMVERGIERREVREIDWGKNNKIAINGGYNGQKNKMIGRCAFYCLFICLYISTYVYYSNEQQNNAKK
jgi:hypothetical protein